MLVVLVVAGGLEIIIDVASSKATGRICGTRLSWKG